MNPASEPIEYPCRQIAMLAVNDSVILDICAPLDVFSFVNLWMQMTGKNAAPVYKLSVVAHQVGPVTTTSGLKIFADRHLEETHDDVDTLLMAGGLGAEYDTPGSASHRLFAAHGTQGAQNGLYLHRCFLTGRKRLIKWPQSDDSLDVLRTLCATLSADST